MNCTVLSQSRCLKEVKLGEEFLSTTFFCARHQQTNSVTVGVAFTDSFPIVCMNKRSYVVLCVKFVIRCHETGFMKFVELWASVGGISATL